MCLAGVSVSVTVTLELELLSSSSFSEEEDEEEGDSGGGSWLTEGRGGGVVVGLEGRGEDKSMTVFSSSSSWTTGITLRVREMEGVRS